MMKIRLVELYSQVYSLCIGMFILGVWRDLQLEMLYVYDDSIM